MEIMPPSNENTLVQASSQTTTKIVGQERDLYDGIKATGTTTS